MVEIETFTYCNRRCWFCPNASLPQRQDKAGNQYMDRALYKRILDDLESIGYRGNVQFGRYNEPLAERDVILDRITMAREWLPRAWLYTHTNGDFLTRDYLYALYIAGLNELQIQTYLGNDERWDEQAMLKRQAQQLGKLGLKIERIGCAVYGMRHQHKTDYPGMDVWVDARNFDAIGTDRGGLLPIRQEEPRTAPCLVPFSALYIDWNGSVMPCCNLRSDVPEHQQYVACRLQDGFSIFDAFVALHSWRKSLMRFGPKAAPCATCRYDEDAVPATAAGELERIYSAACHI
jgi:MoaA/NifB/PqqE/SkfB family radical SAM enzyme